MNAAFDVGADDGFHGILFAFFNPKISVFAFEPIKGSKKEILRNLNYNQVKFDFKLSFDCNTLYSIFSLNLNLGMQDGFDLNLIAKFEDVYKTIMPEFPE